MTQKERQNMDESQMVRVENISGRREGFILMNIAELSSMIKN